MNPRIKSKAIDMLSYAAIYPAVILITGMDKWSTHINGVNPKTGQQLYHFFHDTKEGTIYKKRRGLKHVLSRWKLVAPVNHAGGLDIISYYPATNAISKK